MITKERLIAEARCLKSEFGENPEYDRALCDLIGYVTAHAGQMGSDNAENIAEELRIDY